MSIGVLRALPALRISFLIGTKKGFLMRQIIPEINARLERHFTGNMFVSAAFILMSK